MPATNGTQLEEITRAATLLLHDSINDAVRELAEHNAAADTAFAIALGKQEYSEMPAPYVRGENVFPGHNPELVERPKDGFPNLSVMAYNSTSAPDPAQMDQLDANSVQLFVECVCRHDDPFVLNCLVQRLKEAVHLVLVSDATLGGLTDGHRGAPTVTIFNVEPVDNDGGRGEGYIQGARLDYSYTTYYLLP